MSGTVTGCQRTASLGGAPLDARARRSLYAGTALMLLMLASGGCSGFLLNTNTQTTERSVSAGKSTRVSPDWTYGARIATKQTASGVDVRLDASRWRTCRTTERLTTHRSRATRRSWKGGSAAIYNGIAVVTAVVLGGALYSRYGAGNPLANEIEPTTPNGARSGWRSWSTTGKVLVVAGAAAGVVIPFVGYHDFRAIDGTESLGSTSKNDVVTTKCQEQSAGGVDVVVGTLFSGKTDVTGRVEFSLSNAGLVDTAVTVKVGGAIVPSHELDRHRAKVQQAENRRLAQAAQAAKRQAALAAQVAAATAASADRRKAKQANLAASTRRFSARKGRWTHPLVHLSFRTNRRWRRNSSRTAMILKHSGGMTLMVYPWMGSPAEANKVTSALLMRYSRVKLEFKQPKTDWVRGVHLKVQKGTGVRSDGTAVEWIWITATDPKTRSGYVFTLAAEGRALYRYGRHFFGIVKSLKRVK